MTPERVEWHLWNWANWMHGGLSSHLQDRHSASSGIGKSGSSDFDQMVGAEDARCAKATDRAIDDLPEYEKSAVYTRQLYQRWGHPLPALPIYYAQALEIVGRKLDRAGIV